ncbi:MAG: PadR family transcriptional regulator [Planctomycetota bacterium]|nr:PadR family transcriptional regulator [Planctomycetota bacterium]
MTGGVDPKFEAELRRGVVQVVALLHLESPRYGYDLVRLLGEAGFAIEEGTLYPILRRFEKQGVLSSRWDTDGARPRKYYELSADGRELKDAMLKAWDAVREATEEAIRQAAAASDGAASESSP